MGLPPCKGDMRLRNPHGREPPWEPSASRFMAYPACEVPAWGSCLPLVLKPLETRAYGEKESSLKLLPSKGGDSLKAFQLFWPVLLKDDFGQGVKGLTDNEWREAETTRQEGLS